MDVQAVLPMARDGRWHAVWARRGCHAAAVTSPSTPATGRHLAHWQGSPQPGDVHVQAPPPTGYLEIERVLRLLALGESDIWIAGRLRDVDHPAAAEAATLLLRGRRRQAQAVLETTLLQLAGAADGRGLGWFRNAGL